MRRAVILLGIILTGFGSYAQKKVKYKDLYVLLRAKNYEVASDFLVTFLIQEPDHPNANYQMGLMLEQKLKELDLLNDTEAIVTRADSSIFYFDKAKGLITEKEVKKHDDDYYELYKRRNLRTGKFEVILSDVQLDIEKRVEALNLLKGEVNVVKERFAKAISFYEKVQQTYSALKEKYIDVLTLSLAASDSTFDVLLQLGHEYDSALFNLNSYKSARKALEGDRFEDIIIIKKQLEGFSAKGLEEADFYSKKIDIYDFHVWSANQQAQIKSKRELVRNLIAFDESLDKMAEDIERDSVNLSGEVFGMVTSPVMKELKMVDYDSWLMSMYQYKIGQLNLKSLWMGWYNQVADTLDLGVQLNYAKKIRSQVEGVLKLEKGLEELDAEPFVRRYHKVVESRFTNLKGLTAYIGKQKDIVADELEEVNKLDSLLAERDKWALWGEDSLMLELSKNDSIGYATLYSDSLADRAYVIAGIYYREDTPKLFFGNVPSSRIIDTLYYAPKEIEPNLPLDSIEIVAGKNERGKYAILYLENSQATLVFATLTKGIEWVEKLKGIVTVPTISITEDNISILQEGSEPIFYNLDSSKGTATSQASSTEN